MLNVSVMYPSAPNEFLYHVCTDAEVNRTDRANIVGKPNMPMVWEFEEIAVKITFEWQMFLVAINYGMSLHYIAALLNDGRAFCNHTGLNGNTPRRNYIEGRDTNALELPRFDEVRTCGGSVVKMMDGYVQMMDGNYPPPMRSGYARPTTVEEAKLTKYLYTPQTHPEYFFAAVYTGDDYQPRPFGNGATYSWYKNGAVPVSFLPHVCPTGRVAFPPKQSNVNTPTLIRL